MDKNWSAKDIPSQAGRRAVVTGATSGIGYHTALELARAGADVILAVRDAKKGAEAIAAIRAEVPAAKVATEPLDLQSLASVRGFAERLVARGGALDLLINNAGIMALPRRETTADGFEAQLGTNHLGHFALTGLLLPLLARVSAPRVVTVSSSVTAWAKMDLENLQSEKKYSPMATYGQSKLANLMFMLELDRRAGASGLISAAAHPGATISGLQKHEFRRVIKIIGQPASRGALPSLYAAVGDEVKGGSYLGPRHLFGMQGPPTFASLPKRAKDADTARALWQKSQELTGVTYAFGDAGATAARRVG
jgi:NAD(P)-dependent dehydrogenase (short-subunit alcohol dehydrogenase family)